MTKPLTHDWTAHAYKTGVGWRVDLMRPDDANPSNRQGKFVRSHTLMTPRQAAGALLLGLTSDAKLSPPELCRATAAVLALLERLQTESLTKQENYLPVQGP